MVFSLPENTLFLFLHQTVVGCMQPQQKFFYHTEMTLLGQIDLKKTTERKTYAFPWIHAFLHILFQFGHKLPRLG